MNYLDSAYYFILKVEIQGQLKKLKKLKKLRQ